MNQNRNSARSIRFALVGCALAIGAFLSVAGQATAQPVVASATASVTALDNAGDAIELDIANTCRCMCCSDGAPNSHAVPNRACSTVDPDELPDCRAIDCESISNDSACGDYRGGKR